VNYFLYDWKQFRVFVGGNLFIFEDQDIGGDDQGSNQTLITDGFRGYMSLRYELRDDMGVNGTGFIERYTHETDDFEWTRLSLGTQVQFYYML
jgi:hypothetical protein